MKTLDLFEACKFAGVSYPTLARGLALFRGRVKWGAKYGVPLPYFWEEGKKMIRHRDLVVWARARKDNNWYRHPEFRVNYLAGMKKARPKITRSIRAHYRRRHAALLTRTED